MMHPDTELRFVNKALGYGVFATKLIPKGTITWILDELDQKLEESYILSLNPTIQEKLLKYCYRDNQGRYVLCWDIARFVNHSFNASCISTAYEFELAARDIYPGEELTDDYGYLNLDEPFYCFPEEGSDRTVVMPDDILHFYPQWDSKAAEAMKFFNQVAQPLKSLLEPRFTDKVNAVAAGKEPMDSILNCYYDRSQKITAVT
jgi:hypothetical protein